MSDTEARLRPIVASHLCVEPERITATARFDADLGADSLDAVELPMAVEEEFGFEFTDDEADATFGPNCTFGSACTLIDAKRAAVSA